MLLDQVNILVTQINQRLTIEKNVGYTNKSKLQQLLFKFVCVCVCVCVRLKEYSVTDGRFHTGTLSSFSFEGQAERDG